VFGAQRPASGLLAACPGDFDAAEERGRPKGGRRRQLSLRDVNT
jgi:hypothetical protein